MSLTNISEWFKKAGTKIKITVAAIVGFLGLFLFFFIRQKIRAKDLLENELAHVESEKELIRLEGDEKVKKQKLEQLREDEFTIREKISLLEKMETEQNREVSIEELDDFFDKRGF